MTGKELRPSRVVVSLGGEDRELLYDLNALVELEAHFGGLQGILNIESNLANIRFMLWAGLIHAAPDLTEREVGAMVDTRRLNEYAEAVAQALQNALPPPDPNAEAPQETASRQR